jgi:23S rRNA pseudouridine1911/1915/1917 synthase
MVENHEFTAEDGDAGQRVDKFLSCKIHGVSRTAIKKSFERALVRSDGKLVAAKYVLRGGEHIEIGVVREQPVIPEAVAMALDILFEDGEIIGVNKPAGIVVHSGNGTTSPTLVEGILSHCGLSMLGGPLRPGVVHRLDKETSGAMIFAKTDGAYLELVKKFAARDIKKTYLAIVSGTFPKNFGEINLPIGRNRAMRTKMAVVKSGKDAITRWSLLKTFGGQFSYLKINILTGRTHQIRVHMANMRHPVVGDTTYGYARDNSKPFIPTRTMLHASEIEFFHPSNGAKVKIVAPLPQDFRETLQILASP